MNTLFLTKFRYDWVKIVDFLIKAYFQIFVLFSVFLGKPPKIR